MLETIKKDSSLKDKLIASFRNPKFYCSPLQKLAKQGTRILPHITNVTNIDISKIKVETEPYTLCQNFRYWQGSTYATTNRSVEWGQKNFTHSVFHHTVECYEQHYNCHLTGKSSSINPGPAGAGASILKMV